jgi:hypothetical protein
VPLSSRPTLPFIALLVALGTNACSGRAQAVPEPAPIRVSTYPEPARASVAAPEVPLAPPVAAAPASPAEPPAARDDSEVERAVETRLNARLDLSSPWAPMGEGVAYLAADDAVAPDGGVDVIVQFHGAMLAEGEWRSSAPSAVVVSVHKTGYGVGQYRGMFAEPDRFGALIRDAVNQVGGTHVRRLGLVSYSAGYGAVQDVLSDDGYYAMVDTVVLLDGMHASVTEGLPDEESILVFERFARDAASGAKQLVVTHSSIVPSGYASTTETATMLLLAAGVARVVETRSHGRGMVEWYHADEGGLHVRGFRGDGARDHLDQAHLVGDVAPEFITPRWTRWAVLDEARGRSIEL